MKKEIEKIKIKPGDILITSWGYNMTINDYCKVIDNTGKTLKCIMIDRKVENDNGMGNGRSIPIIETEIGDPFRVRINKIEDRILLVGSYNYTEKDKRKGYWYIWDGKPDYYNTWD